MSLGNSMWGASLPEVDLNADPEGVEVLVGSIRRGLTGGEDENGE